MHTENNTFHFTTEGSDAFIPWLRSRAEQLSRDTESSRSYRDGRLTAVTDALEGHLSDMSAMPNSSRHDPFSEGYSAEAADILKLVRYREDPKPLTVAVDFDNTLARSVSSYPEIGEEVPEAFHWLSRWEKSGIRLILWTMRTGDALADALSFCAERGVTFWGVNANPAQVIYPHPASGKCFSHFLIDDTAIGCPLDTKGAVDWSKVGPMADKAINAWLA